MNSSLVESLEVFLLIPGLVLGNVMANRALKDRLMVVRIKDIEQGLTNADQDAKKEPDEGCRNMLTDGENISKGCGS